MEKRKIGFMAEGSGMDIENSYNRVQTLTSFD